MGLFRDGRYAVRILAGTPALTLALILTLALAIGPNVAMFSIVYGVLLRPLPYHDADRLVLARAEVAYAGTHRPVPVSIQFSELELWQRSLDAIVSTAFYTSSDVVALLGDSGSEVLDSAVVSGTFFTTMAGPFVAGRALGASDDAAPLAVISERLAHRLFGNADRAIGGRLPLTRGTFTVIGVAGSALQFPTANVDVWLPAGFVHAADARCCGFQVMARLAPGGTAERARAALQPMFQNSAYGRGATANAMQTSVVGLADDMVSAVRPVLLVLFASVLMVLVIACGNSINLLLARNAAREAEFAIRRALGATPNRLMRQLLLESAILAIAGTASGAILARLCVAALAHSGAGAIPRIDAIHIDRAAVLFAAGLAVVATVVTGITPALRAARDAPIPKQAGTATEPGVRRLQRMMCVVQVALAVMLLAGAALMGRSLARLLHVDLGIAPDHVLTASLNLAFGKRPADAETVARVDRVIDGVRALPGVRSVGAGTGLPPGVSRMMVTLRRAGDSVDYRAAAVPATPGYFQALRMRLIKGRFFTEADDERHPPVMIMSEGTARRFFGTDESIGRTMSLPVVRDGTRSTAEMTLIGITANVKYSGLAAPPDDVVYRPFAQQPWVAPFLIVRTSGDPADFAPTLRRAIAAVDPGTVVSQVTSLDQIVMNATAQPRFRAVLLASFAALALAIAGVGLYGVVAYAVSRRTREIGIRMALGATSREVLAMVLGEGLRIAVAGVAIGTVGAWALSGLLTGLLYGIAPTDPLSFVVASAGLLSLTLLATYIPARRAARIDPIGALRES